MLQSRVISEAYFTFVSIREFMVVNRACFQIQGFTFRLRLYFKWDIPISGFATTTTWANNTRSRCATTWLPTSASGGYSAAPLPSSPETGLTSHCESDKLSLLSLVRMMLTTTVKGALHHQFAIQKYCCPTTTIHDRQKQYNLLNNNTTWTTQQHISPKTTCLTKTHKTGPKTTKLVKNSYTTYDTQHYTLWSNITTCRITTHKFSKNNYNTCPTQYSFYIQTFVTVSGKISNHHDAEKITIYTSDRQVLYTYHMS